MAWWMEKLALRVAEVADLLRDKSKQGVQLVRGGEDESPPIRVGARLRVSRVALVKCSMTQDTRREGDSSMPMRGLGSRTSQCGRIVVDG